MNTRNTLASSYDSNVRSTQNKVVKFFSLVNRLYHLPMEAHNQKFFNAGEVSWHVDKHVVKKYTKKRPRKGRFSIFYSPIVKTAFSKSGHFFRF